MGVPRPECFYFAILLKSEGAGYSQLFSDDVAHKPLNPHDASWLGRDSSYSNKYYVIILSRPCLKAMGIMIPKRLVTNTPQYDLQGRRGSCYYLTVVDRSWK